MQKKIRKLNQCLLNFLEEILYVTLINVLNYKQNSSASFKQQKRQQESIFWPYSRNQVLAKHDKDNK